MRIGKEEDTGDVEGDEVASLKGFSRVFFFFFFWRTILVIEKF